MSLQPILAQQSEKIVRDLLARSYADGSLSEVAQAIVEALTASVQVHGVLEALNCVAQGNAAIAQADPHGDREARMWKDIEGATLRAYQDCEEAWENL